MKIQYYSKAADFLAAVGQHLFRDEARYGLILGLAQALTEKPHQYGQDDPWFCTVGKGSEVSAVAMRTPPYSVVVAHFTGDFVAVGDTLITAVSQQYPVIPGVVGDKELADVFSELWCKKYRTNITHTMAQRIYKLDKVNNVPLSPGKMRPATIKDRALVVKWTHAFHLEAMAEPENTPETDITPVLKRGWVFFWEDGRPVSIAAKTRPTDNGMAVGLVYTPPELRRKGYATSCVAGVSRNVLRSGYQFCTLYTDLSNPTSNSIYKKIGYKEVGDSVQHMFEIQKA